MYLALPVLADGIMHLTAVVPGKLLFISSTGSGKSALCFLVVFPPLGTVEVEPVVRVAAAHGNAILSQTQY